MTLVNDIYEAAMLPEYWPTALKTLCERIGAEGCTLVTIDAEVPRWTSSIGFADKMEAYLDGQWHNRNEPMERLVRSGSTGFLRDIDLFSREEVENLPIVRDFKRPAGFGWSAAMATAMPGGEMLLFSIEQLWDRGPLSDEVMRTLEDLRPHISRAALLAAKLRHRQAEAAVESLNLAGVPAALVTHRGQVIAANAGFLSFKQQLFVGAHDRLQIGAQRSAELVQAALDRLSRQFRDDAPMSIAVPAALEDEVPLVVHVVPTKGRARDVLGPMTALVIVTRVGSRPSPPASLLRALFDLTPTESRVCEALLSGVAKADLQRSLAITEETERTHVKSILRKTGLKRRIDLVRFLGGLSAPQ